MRHTALVFVLSILMASGTPRPGRGVEEEAERHSVEAAMMAHFASLVTWPADAFASGSSSFVVCVFREDPFGSLIDRAFANKKVGSRSITIERRRRGGSASGCQIAFVNGASSSTIEDLVAQANRSNVLTVTDDRDAFENGLIVGFFLNASGKVGFEIDRRRASQAGLKVNKFLLTLSTSMVQEREQGS